MTETAIVNSVSNFIEIVNKIRNTDWNRSPQVFLRGVSDFANHRLEPTAFRGAHPTSRERRLLAEFQLRAPSHGIRHNDEEITRWLVDMQHYGIPTRLLDWSLSPLVALYFATARGATDGAVYLLNSKKLLQFSREKPDVSWLSVTSHNVEARATLIHQNENQVKKHPDYANLKLKYPVPFFPQISNNRLTAQSGCFTIHGSSKLPLDLIDEEIHIKNKDHPIGRDNFLKVIKIDKDFKASIQAELEDLNINVYTIFPDLWGLAEKMKLKHI